ncbi:hypothetical protein Tsubulata_051199 [Turnera subulata]|uniref:KIB1-4 beta-propeller domain-containing protein n=1 Tax=Turnera subulata TaxID=218843 RepID=A0A9Q0J5J4_9ROSI|nr:hypothetical protein Tsubulata_051199 [Turnera subulata]
MEATSNKSTLLPSKLGDDSPHESHDPCQSYPCLLICDELDDGMQRQTFYSISDKRCHTSIIPELHNKNIVWCNPNDSEWMLVEDAELYDHFLWNVVSRERIQLPSVGDFGYYDCAISSAPTDPNCHIVFSGDDNVILYSKLGDDEYSRYEFEESTEELRHLASIGGKIYGTLSRRLVVALEFGEEKSGLRLNPILGGARVPPVPPHIHQLRIYIVGCGDEVLLVERHSVGRSEFEVSNFAIYKADFTSGIKEWTKMDDGIGPHTIFLDNNGRGVCCPTADPAINKNSIYYLNDDRYIYVWDLEKQSVTKHLPSSSVVDDDNCELQWVMLPAGSVPHKLA